MAVDPVEFDGFRPEWCDSSSSWGIEQQRQLTEGHAFPGIAYLVPVDNKFDIPGAHDVKVSSSGTLCGNPSSKL